MISYSCLISTYYLLENLPTFQNSYNFSSDNLTHLYKYLHFKSPTCYLCLEFGFRLSQIFHRMFPNRHSSLAQSSLERLPSAVDGSRSRDKLLLELGEPDRRQEGRILWTRIGGLVKQPQNTGYRVNSAGFIETHRNWNCNCNVCMALH